MIRILLFLTLQFNINPQNPTWDRYRIIPPLGKIRSIAASDLMVFAASDEYLLFVDKIDYTFQRSVFFNRELILIGYDNYTGDLWIFCPDTLVRFNTISYTLRAFPINEYIQRFAVDIRNVYFENAKTGQKFALDKVLGTVAGISNFPPNLKWYKQTAESDIRQYPFLNPYYYYDEAEVSQMPFQRYPITSVYDDGMYLYVGTNGYGLLKYSKTSWDRKRLVYGPLESHINTVKKFGQMIYFLSPSGISFFDGENERWQYLRLNRMATDITGQGSSIFIARNNRVIRTSGNMEFPVSDFTNEILTLSSDSGYIYVATRSGLFRIERGTNSEIPFGPERYAVYYVYPTEDAVYAGGEFALYKYTRSEQTWTQVYNFGVKDITGLRGRIYALGTNNQIMSSTAAPDDSLKSDSSWILLPYFNIYDIDTDDEVLYCATFSGVYYYEPDEGTYRIIYNLPREPYENVFVVNDELIAVSRDAIYSLPVKYRD